MIVLLISALCVLTITIPLIVLYFCKQKKFHVNHKKLKRMMEKSGKLDYFILDLRASGDYEASHIPGAVNVPFGSGRKPLPSENMFSHVFICGTTPREAREGAEYYSSHGYFNVYNLGAFRQWKGETMSMEKKKYSSESSS